MKFSVRLGNKHLITWDIGQYGKLLHSCVEYYPHLWLGQYSTHLCNNLPYCPISHVIIYVTSRLRYYIYTLWQVLDGTSFKAFSEITQPHPFRYTNLENRKTNHTFISDPTIHSSPVSSTHFQPSHRTGVFGSLCVIVSVRLSAWVVAGVDCQL